MEVLVDILTKAKDIATASTNVPEELTSHLQKALDIASGLDDYLEKMTTQESEHLAELYQYVLTLNIQIFMKLKIKKCFNIFIRT